MQISQKAKNAIFLGTLCSVSYLAVYMARNVLGAVTPSMTADGFTLDYIGQVSAVYLLAYAIGQLINGYIGDFIKAKYMITLGLFSAGIANLVFIYLAKSSAIATVAYAWTGFSLSMIYGPMTKVVAESTDLIYATRCSLGYTFASFFGSPMAGVLATFLSWQATFGVSSAMLITMAALCMLFFTIFERKGIVKCPNNKAEGKSAGNKDYRGLLGRSIIKFSLVAILTGVIRTSLVGFLSTYFCDHLGYTKEEATSIFSVVTFIVCFTTFVAIFVYERLNRNIHLCTFIFFAVSAVSFGFLYFVSAPIVNIILMVVAIMAAGAAATMLWSVYCPSMKDTGLVSGVTGLLDFLSYLAAALGSLLIPKMVSGWGWQNTLLAPLALMVIGAAVCVPYFFTKKTNNKTTGR